MSDQPPATSDGLVLGAITEESPQDRVVFAEVVAVTPEPEDAEV